MISPIEMQAGEKVLVESGGLIVSEVVSIAVSLGVVGLADTIAPGILKSASQVIGKNVIEPILDPVENTLSTVCRVKNCQPDKSKSREERAEKIAHTMIIFGSAWAASMATKLYTRGSYNRLTGINAHEVESSGSWTQDKWNAIKAEVSDPATRKIILADEAVHYGSLLYLNTAGASLTDQMIDTTSSALEKAGMSKKSAKELSHMGIIWELPNALGLLAGVGAIAHNHGAHVGNILNSRTSLSTLVPKL